MFIVYVGYDETIVCTQEKEQEVIEDYFKKGGRDLKDYDRLINDITLITSPLLTEGG